MPLIPGPANLPAPPRPRDHEIALGRHPGRDGEYLRWAGRLLHAASSCPQSHGSGSTTRAGSRSVGPVGSPMPKHRQNVWICPTLKTWVMLSPRVKRHKATIKEDWSWNDHNAYVGLDVRKDRSTGRGYFTEQLLPAFFAEPISRTFSRMGVTLRHLKPALFSSLVLRTL